MKKLLLAAAVAFGCTALVPVAAQETSDPAKIAQLREKIRADKRALVAANMNLTEAEAKKFWPIYDSFQREWDLVLKRRAALVLEFINTREMTDLHAKKMTQEALDIEATEARLHKKYFNRLERAIPDGKAARYMQIESKIDALYRYDLALTVPLVY